MSHRSFILLVFLVGLLASIPAGATGTGLPEGSGILILGLMGGVALVFTLLWLVPLVITARIHPRRRESLESAHTARDQDAPPIELGRPEAPVVLRRLATLQYVASFLLGISGFFFGLLGSFGGDWYFFGFRMLYVLLLMVVARGFRSGSRRAGYDLGLVLACVGIINLPLSFVMYHGPLRGDLFAFVYGVVLLVLLPRKYKEWFKSAEPEQEYR